MSASVVFLSHTSRMARFPESRSFVQAAKDAALRAGFPAQDMQFFPAADQPPADVCQEAVRSCPVYIGIFGHDYGSRVRERPDVSYTELEFLTAIEECRRGKMRVYAFLLAEGIPAGDHDRPDADQAEFRRRVCDDHGLTVKFFDDPAKLELEVFHTLREMRSRGRRSLIWRTTIWTAAILAIVGAIAASGLWRTRDGTPPAAVTGASSAAELRDLKIAVERTGSSARGADALRGRVLVSGGVDQVLEALPPIGDDDVFKMVGAFDRPVYSYLLWFDTAGKFEVNDASPERGTVVRFPSDGDALRVNPADPKGIHLLVVVTSETPPAEARHQLEAALGAVGRPPQTLPSRWGVRGGQIVADAGGEEVSYDYLARVERGLPAGFQAAYGLWLRTQ